MAAKGKIYPREGDRQTIYLKEVVSDPNIEVGDFLFFFVFVVVFFFLVCFFGFLVDVVLFG